MALMLMFLLAIPMAVISVGIKLDSKGPVFYRQERITAYGRRFMIHKFRTMVSGSDKTGSVLTTRNDARITKVGAKLRAYHLDELPQILDVLAGNMSFVGTRPEVPEYVRKYSKEMRATLLLPAGITSEASIRYRDESKLLNRSADIDKIYIKQILPDKMKYNLESIEKFSLKGEFKTMFKTVTALRK
jgi:lipopolysaccharide/colanic/teichoic acid biosynthesis glycosyltransferase